jgi:hypothetical protein
VFLKRRWGRVFDGPANVTSDEILAELKREYTPSRKTVIRTQTEYLPFLFERIRETIDEGFEDPQVHSLLDRIELHRAGEERRAVFSIVHTGTRSELHLRWIRDAWDRIELHVQASPGIIRALRDFKRTIPRGLPG